MTIALMSQDEKKELMVHFCTAYCGELCKHTLCATYRTGHMISEATGLDVNLFLTQAHGGVQQIGARIAYDEIDMVLFFNDTKGGEELEKDIQYIIQLCDKHSVPFASNVATAEMLIHGLARGDLDWRSVMTHNRIPFKL